MNSAGLIRQSQRTDDRARRVGGSKQVGCQATVVTCRGKQRMRAAWPASCLLPLACAFAIRRARHGNRRPAPAGEISDTKPSDINELGGSSVWTGKGLMPVPCGLPGFSCARQDGRDMDSDKHLSGMFSEEAMLRLCTRHQGSSILGRILRPQALLPAGIPRPQDERSSCGLTTVVVRAAGTGRPLPVRTFSRVR